MGKDDDDELVGPPIVDTLRLDRAHNSWAVIFLPEESVSAREKERVSIPLTSPDGRRIALRLERLNDLLGMEIESIFHGGGGNFVFIAEGGKRHELSEPHGRVDLSLRAYVELTDIAMTAQLAFVASRLATA